MQRWAAVLVVGVGVGFGPACTTLLGDFTVGGGGDASTDTTTDTTGSDSPPDVAPDIAVDSPPDAPACGQIGLDCCPNAVCNSGGCCNGKCFDLANDDKNCGTCGHLCQGDGCALKTCKEHMLTKVVDTQPGRVRTTATDVLWLTVNGNHNGSMYACGKGGCGTPTVLFSGLYFGYDFVFDPNGGALFVSDSTSKLYVCNVAGCGQTPSSISLGGGSYYGLSFRQDIFAAYGVQPHQFHPDNTGDIDLGNGNEGTNSITAPNGSIYVFWNGMHTIRYGKANQGSGYGDYWTSSSGENMFLLADDGAYLAWTGEISGLHTVYACSTSSPSCSSPTILATNQRIGYGEGPLAVGPGDIVYWSGMDQSSSHVQVFACPVTGCNSNPQMIANVPTTPGKSSAGGVAADQAFVYFAFEDNGVVFLDRVAK